jgi:hypothetical protein
MSCSEHLAYKILESRLQSSNDQFVIIKLMFPLPQGECDVGNWVRGGLLYGAMGLSIGTILAAVRTLILIPLFGDTFGFLIELALGTITIVIAGLWLMRELGSWTTNSALYFGLLGSATAMVIGAKINMLILGSGLNESIHVASMTHGIVFPVVLAVMAMAPTVLTQRA